MNDTPSHSVIKNILSNFEKMVWLTFAIKNAKNQAKTLNGQNSALNTKYVFSIIKSASAASVSPTLMYHNFHDEIHLKPCKFHP